jgi:hypothetical protein
MLTVRFRRMFEEVFMVLVDPRDFVNSQNNAFTRFLRFRRPPAVERFFSLAPIQLLLDIIFNHIIGWLGRWRPLSGFFPADKKFA